MSENKRICMKCKKEEECSEMIPKNFLCKDCIEEQFNESTGAAEPDKGNEKIVQSQEIIPNASLDEIINPPISNEVIFPPLDET